MEILEQEEKIEPRTKWIEVIDRLKKSKSKSLVLKFEGEEESKKVYNKLSTNYYKEIHNLKVQKRANKVFLELVE